MNISKNDPFAAVLTQLPAAPLYCVAYSGGVDSHVLLHWLHTRRAALPGELVAIHIDHQLQPQSHEWTRHCRDVCAQLGVEFHSLQVQADATDGDSPEAAARAARYAALAEWLPEHALLLAAQHRDDQAETVLLQLLRGAGPRGLAAMPAVCEFGAGKLARPFLSLCRADILAYADRQQLQWIEDPSNADTRYARNHLRRIVMPLLRQHWPGADSVLARAARLQAEQAGLAAALADIDMQQCRLAQHPQRLDCVALKNLDASRRRNVLRHWIHANGFRLPSSAVLEQVLETTVDARPDARPRVHWQGAEIRRYRDLLYLAAPLQDMDSTRRYTWIPGESMTIDPAAGTLSAQAAVGDGLSVSGDTRLEVRFREGGETLRPAGHREHHTLKNLFQEWGVPDWERPRVPLIYAGNRLVAVAGLCVCEDFHARPDETGYRLQWSRLDG